MHTYICSYCSQTYASIIYLTLLLGFTNLGDINRYLDAFERALSSSSDDAPPPLAKTVMVFMVRGLFNKLQFAYAQFPCCQVRGDKLYDPFWEAVCRIEMCGLKVSEMDHTSIANGMHSKE